MSEEREEMGRKNPISENTKSEREGMRNYFLLKSKCDKVIFYGN